MIEIRAEDIEPRRPNIVQEILTRQLDAINDRVWDEIEEFMTPEAVQRYPRWLGEGVWFRMEAP
jgi:hypothetical protein